MAIDSYRKRLAIRGMGTVMPPVIELDGAITSFDKFQFMWSYRVGGSGTLTFYGTTLENGVDSNVFDGVSMDDSGNLRAKGAFYEGSAT